MTQRRIYQCAFPYFVTFNVLNREWIFDDVKKASMLHEIILNAGELKNHLVYQFCIMPDHVHILCQPEHTQQEQVSVPATLCWDCFGFHSAGADVKGAHNMHNISGYMYTVKSFFTHQIRKQFGIEYKFLQTRYNFRIMDNEKYLSNVINYITYNSIKADLPKKYQHHPYQYKDDDLISALF